MVGFNPTLIDSRRWSVGICSALQSRAQNAGPRGDPLTHREAKGNRPDSLLSLSALAHWFRLNTLKRGCSIVLSVSGTLRLHTHYQNLRAGQLGLSEHPRMRSQVVHVCTEQTRGTKRQRARRSRAWKEVWDGLQSQGSKHGPVSHQHESLLGQ